MKHKVGDFDISFQAKNGKVEVKITTSFSPWPISADMDSLDAAAMAVDLKNVAEMAAKEQP